MLFKEKSKLRGLFLFFGLATGFSMFFRCHPWTGGKSNVCLGGEFNPVGFVSIIVEVFVKLVFSDWISGHAGWGNFFLSDPSNCVEDELTVAVNGPVSMMVATGKTSPPSALRPGNSPEQGLGLSFC